MALQTLQGVAALVTRLLRAFPALAAPALSAVYADIELVEQLEVFPFFWAWLCLSLTRS